MMTIKSKESSVAVYYHVKVEHSGQPPSFECSQKNGTIMKVPSHVYIDCKATKLGSSNERDYCVFKVNVEDIQPPKITCPADKEITSNEDDVIINYEKPKVQIDNDGLTPKVHCTIKSGSSRLRNPGVYRIECTAYDKSFNVATCSFKITLKAPDCKPQPPPQNGALACFVQSKLTRTCTVLCNNDYEFNPKIGEVYNCHNGKWTTFYVMNGMILFRTFRLWPHCTVNDKPDHVMPHSFYYKGDARNASTAQQIRHNFMKIMTTLPIPIFCQNKLCKAENIKVTPGKTTQNN